MSIMLAFLRRNLIALVALFIALGGTAYAANTVRSTDIVDGTIKTVDLANKAVTPAKTTGLGVLHYTSVAQTSDCARQANIWKACAGIGLLVPAGHVYSVTVISVVHADPSATQDAHALICAARSGPTCMQSEPDYVTFWKHGVTSATSVASGIFGPGSYSFSTAVKFPFPILADPNAHTSTTLIVTDRAAEQ